MDYYSYGLIVACVAVGAYFAISRKPKSESNKANLPVALQGASVKVSLKLKEVFPITHNTKLFRFSLPSPNHRLGLPIGKHFTTHAVINGEEVSRPYTPTSSDDDIGHVDLVIKVYDKGLMSQHINSLQIGEELIVMGPKGLVTYLGNGSVAVSGKGSRVFTQINMICGGTGITPMLQIIRAIQKNPKDKTNVAMIFGNVSEDDILLRSELELVSQDPRFKIFLTLDRPSEGWKHDKGYVTQDMIRNRLFSPESPGTITLLCGPKPMVDGCKKNLEAMGAEKDNVISF